jgi:hypothetical protein
MAVLLYHVVRVLRVLAPKPTFELPDVAVRTDDNQNQRLLVHRIWRIDVAQLHISNVLVGVVVPSAINPPVWNKSEFTIPLPPVPNLVRYPCVPHTIPEAVTEPENPVVHVASPFASEVRILQVH